MPACEVHICLISNLAAPPQSHVYLPPQEQQLELQRRVGQALRHAGVAITVTSMTDCAAFLIGSTTVGLHMAPPLPNTNSCSIVAIESNHPPEGSVYIHSSSGSPLPQVLPALRSFCIYAAVGVLTLYAFQATFFVAWFTYDQQRMEGEVLFKTGNHSQTETERRKLNWTNLWLFLPLINKYPCLAVFKLASVAQINAMGCFGATNTRIGHPTSVLRWTLPPSSSTRFTPRCYCSSPPRWGQCGSEPRVCREGEAPCTS